jgi:hypothetical protein
MPLFSTCMYEINLVSLLKMVSLFVLSIVYALCPWTKRLSSMNLQFSNIRANKNRYYP